MKRTGIFLISLLLINLITSCEQNSNIVAEIENLGNDTILIEYIPISSEMFEIEEPYRDTVVAKNGKFEYNITTDKPTLVFILPKKAEFIRLGGHPYHAQEKGITVIVKPEDRISIKGELNQYFTRYSAKGSAINDRYSTLRNSFIEEASEAVRIELLIDSLSHYGADRDLINDYFRKRNQIMRIGRTAELQYISDNLDDKLSAYLLTRQPIDTIGKYYAYLSAEVREGSFKPMLDFIFDQYQRYTIATQQELTLKEGVKAPDFSLKSFTGEYVTLSSQKEKSQLIVLDFWGTWCPPCIADIPKMKEYYERYKDQINFIGIACRDNETNWINAIEEHSLEWLQLFNSTDKESDAAIKFGVKAYPTKFILDKDLKIVGRFVGAGNDFYEKIDELMEKIN
ncbi:MAG: TlpA disulfide reductase family protein [Dysgonamonadaceae bacterium]|jgi:thiol-disulfide isomerase/thioredoxin